MADVFISYERQERRAVDLIATRLRALQLEVWFDEKLQPGKAFDETIVQELDRAKVVLTCWTPRAIASEWVRGEAALAREARKLIACFLRPTKLIPPFNQLQTEDLSGWGGEENAGPWLKLLAAIGEIVGRPGLETYYLVMQPAATVADLRAWANAHGSDPLSDAVWSRIKTIEGETAGERIERQRKEAQIEDQKRHEAKARARAWAAARGLEDPARARARLSRLTIAIIVIGLLAAAGVAYLVDDQSRQRQLVAAQTPTALREFLLHNWWHPIAAEARRKLADADRNLWEGARAQGSLAAYDYYLGQAAGEPPGAFIAAAEAARGQAQRVASAQAVLRRLGLLESAADGAFDEATKRAISEFRYKRGLPAAAVVDDDMLRRLQEALDKWVHVRPEELIGRPGPPTLEEYRAIAARLNVDAPTLAALRELEAGRINGIGTDGRPLILFEPSVFTRLTGGRFNETHPSVSGPQANYGSPAQRWAQLSEAYSLAPDAAYEATSFGVFMLLGRLYSDLGFATVGEFARYVAQSEANQVEVLARFLERRNLLSFLQQHDWRSFSRKFHGPAPDQYDKRLQAAYERAAAAYSKAGSPP